MRVLLLVGVVVLSGCALTSHAVQPSKLGTARSSEELLAVIDTPGPVTLETVVSADWVAARSGLINLSHPRAKEAGLTDGEEPAQLYFHVLQHPTHGLFIVDTGVEVALRDKPQDAAFRGVVASEMHFEKMKILTPLGEWLAARKDTPLQGVFITHMHPDHLTGMADAPKGTPVYTGPGEASASAFIHLFVAPNIDRALAGKAPISEWAFAPDAAGRFEGLNDIFGDGSVWALWVPGHTPGSTAYLVRTPSGPVLLTGDACHTRWGWEHDVEPGTFTSDGPRNALNLARLRKLAAEHPRLDVRFGHQR